MTRLPGDGVSIFSGDYFMSTQTFSPEQVKELSRQYDLFDMEAYAAARFCQMCDIPFYCLKAVSDNLDGSLKDWRGILAGSGADTIKKGWADNKWPVPEIKEHFGQNDDRVELTLWIGQSTSSPGKETESKLKTRKKTREIIRGKIGENPSITVFELAEQIGISRKGIEWHIAKMKSEGILEREGPDKGGRWIVK